MQKLVIATHNANKYREIAACLVHLPFELVSIASYDALIPEENAVSFIENALIKARAACQETGEVCLADDSGLCVFALQGAPGVLSRRFAHEAATDQENWQTLLVRLSGVEDRRAFFYCTLVLMRTPQDPAPIIAQGCWPGTIIHTADRPDIGFGYEPVFLPEGDTQTANHWTLVRKNSHSHRGRAMASLLAQLSDGAL